MPRPRQDHPTPGELELLQVLWERGPSTVREVLEVVNQTRPRAYTSVMTLLNVMADKGLVRRTPQGRAHLYEAADNPEKTLGGMVGDLLNRAFEGSKSALINHLFDETPPSDAELDEIRKLLDRYENPGSADQGGKP